MKTKTSYHIYPAWAFEREVADLEKKSSQGWQLTKGGLIHSTFAFDDTVRYRYALDFNQDIQDPMRYREIFAEQGWEFVNSTFNGWHYFRKLYDPSLPEEAYQIYTDRPSREEMLGRWKRLARTVGVVELVLAAAELSMNLKYPTVHGFCLALGCLLLGVLLLLSGKWMGQADRPKLSGWLLVPVGCFLIAGLVFVIFRTPGFTTETEYAASEENDPWQAAFDVKLPDVYTLNVSIDAPAPVWMELGKDGEGPLYRWEGTEHMDTIHFFLTPGTYRIYTQYLPGAQPGLSGEIKYELN